MWANQSRRLLHQTAQSHYKNVGNKTLLLKNKNNIVDRQTVVLFENLPGCAC
jgi:hypothetical protein